MNIDTEKFNRCNCNNPCKECNECFDNGLDCGSEGCPLNLDLSCTTYTGEDKPPFKIFKGMSGQAVFEALENYLLDFVKNVEIMPTAIRNVGDGVVTYKGLSRKLIHEFKTLASNGSLDIIGDTDVINISVNQQWLTQIVNRLIIDNSTVSMEFLYSASATTPGAPDVDTSWSPTYSPNAEWMAFREVFNSIPTPWKVIKVRGKDGRDGRDGRDGYNGNTSFTSIIFKRSATQPTTPTGGGFSNPVPSGWSDGIPEADGNPLWMSARIFSSDGAYPQESSWSTPSLAADTADIDFEWSNFNGEDPGTPSNPANGAVWDNNASPDDNWMAIAKISNGVRGPWEVFKIKGEQGNSSVTINIFKRSQDKPSVPAGGTFFSPIPSGWSDGIPAENGNPAWMSTRIFSSDGGYPQQANWADPIKVADTSDIDFEFSEFEGPFPGDPTTPLNGAVWTNDANENTVWMAVSKIENGVRGPWKVSKIKGEGIVGQGIFKSIVFKRSQNNTPITTRPTGGDFFNPVPVGWEDGIPSGTGAVYQSYRTFTSNGEYPQDDVWSEPVLAVDNEYKDYAYSSQQNKPTPPANTQSPLQDDGTWHNNPTENDVWQAVRDVKNGVYGVWTVQRIKGEDGVNGTGYSLVSSNPIQSLAVGSDGIASSAKNYDVKIDVYQNSTKLTATSAPSLTASQYRVELPTGLPTGITVARVPGADDTLRFSVAANTSIPDNIVSTFDVSVGTVPIKMKSSFTIVPIKTAEDSLSLSLITSGEVVKFTANGAVDTPQSITLEALQQNYTETVTWTTVPTINGLHGSTGKSKTVNSVDLFPTASNSVRIRISTPNGLFDEVTIVRVKDGSNGAPGISGTQGPSPRTFEWFPGATYQISDKFIDYAYVRNESCRGWYTVKPVAGQTKTEVVAAGTCPDLSLFEKAPFTAEMTFSTVIAEQANLAGFLFRNQILTSQFTGYQSCQSTNDRGPFPNLSIDGRQGIIKFLEKLILSKEGIAIKDDCGRNRMVFMFEGGVPVLRFYDETGKTIWEAGQNNFGYTTLGGYFTSRKGVKINSGTDVNNAIPPEINPYVSNVNGTYTSSGVNLPTFGYKYIDLENEVSPALYKTYKQKNLSSGFVEDGTYLISIEYFIRGTGIRQPGLELTYQTYESGLVTSTIHASFPSASNKVYRNYATDLYGGSGDTLDVHWVDKDGNPQHYSQRGEGHPNWMSFHTCAEEGTFNSTGTVIEGDIC